MDHPPNPVVLAALVACFPCKADPTATAAATLDELRVRGAWRPPHTQETIEVELDAAVARGDIVVVDGDYTLVRLNWEAFYAPVEPLLACSATEPHLVEFARMEEPAVVLMVDVEPVEAPLEATEDTEPEVVSTSAEP